MEIVVYTQRVEIVESYGERRDCADQRIAEFLKTCGYLPVPIPNDADMAELYIRCLHPVGIVLTGGNSLLKYGGNAPERDAMDRKMIELALELKVPLYGFCRGMQSILDYFGNNLINVEGHVAVKHNISGGGEDRSVNSYHNQACIDLLCDDLIATMRSDDGVIEKVAHANLPLLGTMWHPEREDPFKDEDINMLKELFGGK